MDKIITKIECCGAKFQHGHDLGALGPWDTKSLYKDFSQLTFSECQQRCYQSNQRQVGWGTWLLQR